MKFVYVGLIAVNIISFALFAIDKIRAERREWRISEATLIFFSLVGGSMGSFLAMQFLRHKTKTPLFKYGVPLALTVHIIIAVISVNHP